jgi:hypothetical protein
MAQANAWAAAHPGQSVGFKVIPAKWAQHGQQEGVIVNVAVLEGRIVYTIERGGDLMDLVPDMNFDILPEEKGKEKVAD